MTRHYKTECQVAKVQTVQKAQETALRHVICQNRLRSMRSMITVVQHRVRNAQITVTDFLIVLQSYTQITVKGFMIRMDQMQKHARITDERMKVKILSYQRLKYQKANSVGVAITKNCLLIMTMTHAQRIWKDGQDQKLSCAQSRTKHSTPCAQNYLCVQKGERSI